MVQNKRKIICLYIVAPCSAALMGGLVGLALQLCMAFVPLPGLVALLFVICVIHEIRAGRLTVNGLNCEER